MEEIKNTPFWHRSTFMTITGASRGIGKQLAIEFSRLINSDSIVLLLARSLTELEETKKDILDINPALNVEVQSVDLSKPDLQFYDNILNPYVLKNKKYKLHFLVHNAANIICEIPASEMNDLRTWNEYMSLNLYSVTLLTSAFLKLFPEGDRCLLNITSLAGVQPIRGLAYYCIGKASREMYFRMLAVEDPSLNILNYSPGPIETDLFLEVAEKCFDAEVKHSFKIMMNDKKTVKMEDAIQKLINVLDKRCYQSGGRIDYFDI